MGSVENQNINKPDIFNEEDEAWIHSCAIVTSSVLPMVLNTIIELNVFEIIDQAPAPEVSAAYIVSKLPQTSNNRHGSSALDRMLRLLATHSLLTSSTRKLENGGYERLYGVTKAGKLFIKSEHGSLASFSFLSSSHSYLGCYIKDAVLEGAIPFNKAKNMSVYEYMQKDPELNEGFDKAMSDQSLILVNQILKHYDGFEGLTSLVDVGGQSLYRPLPLQDYPPTSLESDSMIAVGWVSKPSAAAWKGSNGFVDNDLKFLVVQKKKKRGINFDLPRVSNNATSYKGIENVEGDMFKEVPNGSAILLKWILHNWNDEDCLRILKNCYEALPDTGKVIVMEMVYPEMVGTSPLSKYASQFDNTMLMGFGAKERSEEEYKALAMAAGFSGFQVAFYVYGHGIIEFHK
ncbi:hypothetical protein PTKIN_Ptkin01aG0030400 [Pterospermum kingtungense]